MINKFRWIGLVLATLTSFTLLLIGSVLFGQVNLARAAAPQFDLAITQSINPPSPVQRGKPITITLSFTATGDAIASGILITDIIPSYILTPSVSSQGAVITSTGATSFIWQVGNLMPGQSGKITIRGTVSPNLYRDFAFTNSVSIYSADEGNNRDNNLATATIVIANASPIAVDDFVTISKNSWILMSYQGNDVDPDPNDHMFTIVVVGTALHGTTTITNTGGAIIYRPNVDFSGFDTFTYTISDYHGGFATGTVHVTVKNTPIANDDVVLTDRDQPITIAILANDTDTDNKPLSIQSVTTPAHGTVTIQGTNVIYTPAKDYVGSDTFTYTITDGLGGTDSATVTITVQATSYKVYLPFIIR